MMEVRGNGNVISRETKVSSFIRLHLAVNCLTELHQADEEKVIVETDENLQEFFEIDNSGKTLYVSLEAKFNKPVYTRCKIKVYLRQIHMLFIRNDNANVVWANQMTHSNPLEIKIESVGDTELDISAPFINIINASLGKVTARGRCTRMNICNASLGHFTATELMAYELIVKNSSSGSVQLFANRQITIGLFGDGYVHYSYDNGLESVLTN